MALARRPLQGGLNHRWSYTSMVDRDEFVQKLKLKLDEWNADIEQLEGRAQRAGGRIREESGQLVARLRERRDHIEEDLRELRQSAGEAWHDLREGLEEAGEDLRAAIADARKHMKRREDE